jgi:hypothetical protein
MPATPVAGRQTGQGDLLMAAVPARSDSPTSLSPVRRVNNDLIEDLDDGFDDDFEDDFDDEFDEDFEQEEQDPESLSKWKNDGLTSRKA